MTGMLMSIRARSKWSLGDLAQAVHAVLRLDDLDVLEPPEREDEQLPHRRAVFDDQDSLLLHAATPRVRGLAGRVTS